MIMATHADIAKQHTCPVSPISWGCKKIQKVVTSTLAAETASLSSTLDQLSWLRLFWGWLLQPDLNWQKSKQALDNLPKTYAASIMKDPDMAVTDCKSLYDLVTRTAPPNCQEFRTQLQARAIKDLLSEGVNLHWVHSGAQVADALTKIMQSTFLRHTLEIGMYKLHDAQEILRERASDRNRVKWLQCDQSNSTKLWENLEVLGVWFSNQPKMTFQFGLYMSTQHVQWVVSRFQKHIGVRRSFGWGQPLGRSFGRD